MNMNHIIAENINFSTFSAVQMLKFIALVSYNRTNERYKKIQAAVPRVS